MAVCQRGGGVVLAVWCWPDGVIFEKQLNNKEMLIFFQIYFEKN